MAQCPQCYTGTCARHKRQDHGRSLVAAPANAQQTMAKIYDLMVGAKLKKLQAEAELDPSARHTEEFRHKLDASRDKSMRKASKKRSKSSRSGDAVAAGSGLNPQALAAIYNDSSADEGGRSDRKERKRKKRKSEKKRKHRKRSRSESDSSDEDESSSSSSSEDEQRRERRRRYCSRSRSRSPRRSSSSSNKRRDSKSSKRRRHDSD